MKRIGRLLRSRLLALWAILAVILYSAVATTTSVGDWATPYRSPIFLVLVALLAASTAACAWERTRAALIAVRRRQPSPATLDRLRERPGIVIQIPDGVEALGVVAGTLRALHMRVVGSGDAIEARGGISGALGSSVFHWALVLLFVVISLGQLTRAEGILGVVAGSSKPDTTRSYVHLEKGPLAGELTGRVIAVPRVASTFTANGVAQGITPYVEIRSADSAAVLTSGYAYANHPIRYRTMLVHLNSDGLAAVVQVSGRGRTYTDEVMIDYNADRSAAKPETLGIAGVDGSTIATVIIGSGMGSTREKPRVSIRVAAGDVSAGMQPEVAAVIGEGEQVQILPGLTLKVLELTKSVRLSVVDDWSVPYIYALFVLAMGGLVLAVFAPPRGARALLVVDGDRSRLHVAVRHGRGDPYFAARVEAELRSALGVGEEPA